MPMVTIQLLAGRSAAQKSAVARRVTAAMVEECGCAAADVSVVFADVEPADWFVAGRSAAAATVEAHGPSSLRHDSKS